MIKNMMRGLAALSLSLTPLIAPAPAQADEVLQLAAALDQVRVADESRAGYTRDKFKHWNSGLDLGDGCNTRAEVLLAEAVEAPAVATGCKLSGGEWTSYYDGVEVNDPGKLDIDHMVPLAEAWDSGASAWTPARREAYANDQDASTSLVAVTARSNRQKADQDPRDWMPPLPSAHCRYISEWVGTKLRWNLAADNAEMDALAVFAHGDCAKTAVIFTPAP